MNASIRLPNDAIWLWIRTKHVQRIYCQKRTHPQLRIVYSRCQIVATAKSFAFPRQPSRVVLRTTTSSRWPVLSPERQDGLRHRPMPTRGTTSTSRTAASTPRSWAALTRGQTMRILDTWTQSLRGWTMTSTVRSSAPSSKTLSVDLLPFTLQLPSASYQLLKFTHTNTKFSKTACSPRFFTPTFQYFYTDTSAISVTFRNSVNIFCQMTAQSSDHSGKPRYGCRCETLRNRRFQLFLAFISLPLLFQVKGCQIKREIDHSWL